MVNHLRTLLLNIAGSSDPGPGYPGEEFVPAEYSPRTLTPLLVNVRRMLYGANPDRAMLNYRVRELLAMLHSTELAEFVYALDPRVTYWPASSNIFDRVAPGAEVTPLAGTTKQLYVLNTPGFITAEEQLYSQWQVEVLNGTDVRVRQLTGTLFLPAPVTYSYTLTAGLSSLVPLTGSQEQCRFEAGVGSLWQVSWLAQPRRRLADVLQAAIAGFTGDLINELFDTVEPYLTFKNLWQLHPQPIYRLSGLVLAFGYRINELRA